MESNWPFALDRVNEKPLRLNSIACQGRKQLRGALDVRTLTFLPTHWVFVIKPRKVKLSAGEQKAIISGWGSKVFVAATATLAAEAQRQLLQRGDEAQLGAGITAQILQKWSLGRLFGMKKAVACPEVNRGVHGSVPMFGETAPVQFQVVWLSLQRGHMPASSMSQCHRRCCMQVQDI